MPDLSQEKSELRREIRARRLALSHADRTNASIRIAETLASLPGWPEVSRLAIYLAQNGEVDTQALAQLARRQGKQLYLPVLAGDGHMDFALWEPGQSWCQIATALESRPVMCRD